MNRKEWNYDDDDEMPNKIYKQMMAIHAETATALQIVLCTKSFVPGTYEKTNPYDNLSWRKVP